MPKKSSTKVATDQKEEHVAEAAKTPITSEKDGDEIDEIFSSKKRKKTGEKVAKTEENVNKKPKKTKKKKKVEVSEDNGLLDPSSKPRRKTNDGLAIYTTEELGFNRKDAGGTPLCPFDCSCCF